MSEKPVSQLTPFDEGRHEIIVDETAEPISYLDIRQQLGIAGIPVPAKELIDQTFTIYRAKEFDSSFKDGEHAYFCVIKLEAEAEKYSTVIGGGACVEVLDAISRSNIERPVKVTLRYKEAGKFSGYYYFE